MKTKKALLPVLASALLLTMGLAACNNSTPASNPGSSSGEAEEVKIEITSEGGKKEIQVGETLQLTASVEGVAWSTKSTDIVSVSETGLVTAIKDGSARITAKKDGYANGSFTVTVLKAPDREPNYSLRLEEAEHYDPDDFWGMDLSAYGMGVMGPGDSPVEDNGGKTDDGTSLGWLQQGCKETMTFTSNRAVKVELGVTMAYNAEMNLEGVLSVNWNDQDPNYHHMTASNNVEFSVAFSAKIEEGTRQLTFSDEIIKEVHIDDSNSVEAGKSASVDKQNGKLKYTVTIKSTGKSTNVVLEDTLTGQGLSLDAGSFAFSSNTGQVVQNSVTVNGNHFTVTIPSMKNNETITLFYDANIDTSVLQMVDNKIIIQAGNSAKVQSEDDQLT